jgi:hypothetical protein
MESTIGKGHLSAGLRQVLESSTFILINKSLAQPFLDLNNKPLNIILFYALNQCSLNHVFLAG